MLNRRLVSIILVIAAIFGFAVALILAVGFAAHGNPDKWLVPASGVVGFVGVLLALL